MLEPPVGPDDVIVRLIKEAAKCNNEDLTRVCWGEYPVTKRLFLAITDLAAKVHHMNSPLHSHDLVSVGTMVSRSLMVKAFPGLRAPIETGAGKKSSRMSARR